MKKLLCLLLICGIVASASVDFNHAYVNASISGMWPVVAEPGADLRLQIMGSNIGNYEAKNVSITASSEVLTPKRQCLLYTSRVLAGEWVGKDCDFVVNMDVVSGNYKVDLTTRFYDAIGNLQNVVTSVEISVRGTPRFEINNIWTNPSRVAPGDSFTLYMNVSNVGTGDAYNLYFNLSSTAVVVTPARVFVDKIAMDETKVVEMTVDANKNASASVTAVTLGILYENEKGEDATAVETVALNLKGRSKLKVKNIDFSPVDYGAGDRVDMNITIENEGNDAENTDVCISSVLFSRQCYFLGKIVAGTINKAMFTYALPSNTTAGGKGYPMMVELKSDDFSETKVITLVLRDKKADLRISRTKTTPEILYSGSRATVELRIENYGYGDARDTRVKINVDGEWFESIVGKIFGEDRATANFYVPLLKNAGVTDIPVEISYEDSSGKHTINDSTQFTIQGTNNGNGMFLVLAVVVVAVIAFVFRKRIIALVRSR